MLSDLLLLEIYYDAPETAQFYEELSKTYGAAALALALAAGDLMRHQVQFGPDQGRWLFWLTDKGRRKALGAL